MSAFDYFILGIIVSIPVAIAAPFASAAIQQKLAVRNQRQGRLRLKTLELEYAEVRDYHENQSKLLVFVSTRILVLLVFWIGQTVLDVVAGFIVNGLNVTSMTLNSVDGGYDYGVNFGPASEWIGAVDSLVDTVILAILFRAGIRAYRLVRKVVDFERYEVRVKDEMTSIRDQSGLQGSELAAPDA